jgi:hypothetical protein
VPSFVRCVRGDIADQVALEARKFMAIDGELPQCDVNETLLLESSGFQVEFRSGARAGDLSCVVSINASTQIDGFVRGLRQAVRPVKGSIIVDLRT